MDPELARRYGIATPSPTTTPIMDPVLLKRYGLTPSVQKKPQPTSPEELLKQGLFEEEAHRNPSNAIPNYQKVLDLFDAQRQNASTALFRLAECLRKLGKTNDAITHYQRLIREFPERDDLATLAHHYLPATPTLGPATPKIDPTTGIPLAENPPTVPGTSPTLVVHAPAPRKDLLDVQTGWRGLNPGDITDLSRKLSFLELKKAADNPDVFTSAVALVFPDDTEHRELVSILKSFPESIHMANLRAEEAFTQLPKLTNTLAQLQTTIDDLEARIKQTDQLTRADLQPRLSANLANYGTLTRNVRDAQGRIKEPARLQKLQELTQADLVRRQNELLQSLRTQIRLLQAIEHAETDTDKLNNVLKCIVETTNTTDRLFLTWLTLPPPQSLNESHRKLRNARHSLRDEIATESIQPPVEPAGNAPAQPSTTVNAARARLELAEREMLTIGDEAVRTETLQLELLRTNPRKF